MSERKERSLNDRQVGYLCALIWKLGGKVSITKEDFKALNETGPGAHVHFSVTHDGTMTAEVIRAAPDTSEEVGTGRR
jgi:hypothetical protein